MSVLGQLAKVAKAKPLRSTLDEAVEALARPKGTGAEYLKEIEKTKGVKPTEIKERGIDKVLAELPKVNKEEIVKAVQSKANPAIEEKILGAGTHKELDPQEVKHLRDMVEEHNRDELHPSHYNYMVDLLNRSEKSTNQSLETKVEDLSKKYKTALDNGQKRLANEISDEMEVLYDRQQRLNKVVEDPTKYGQYTLPNGKNYREILLRLPQKENEQFTQSHWDEPNVLAHMRVADRTGPNGEKVLHLEELQSDWHQQGREKGYRDEARRQELLKEIEKLKEKTSSGELPIKDYIKERTPIQSEFIKLSNQVPDAPFKKNWHEVALKKLINYATENGYDKLAITPGAEQAKRYDLSKDVGMVSYDPDKQHFQAFKPNRETLINETGASPERVAELIGKEVSQKLMSAPKNMGHHYLEGENLQIGGEGMKGFYDKILPDYLNKLGKTHGAEVQMHGLPVETGSEMSRGEFGNLMVPTYTPTYTNLHSFDLTPSLKNEVTQKGLPLYQQIGIPLGGAEAVREAQPEPEMKRGGKVTISNNPDTMFMEMNDRKFAGGGLIKKIVEKLGTKMIPAVEAEANKAKFLEPSKVKDVMYHGTDKEFNNFKPNTFLTFDPAFAKQFPGGDKPTGQKILPVHVQVKNPWDYENRAHVRRLTDELRNEGIDPDMELGIHHGDWQAIEHPTVMETIKNLGHDAFFVDEGGKNLMVYDPSKIKSAIGNQGTYDTTSPDITKKRGGLVHAKRHYGIGGIVKALTPMEEALAKMRTMKQAMAPEIALNKRYEEATKDMYTKDMPSFEEWKRNLPPPEVK